MEALVVAGGLAGVASLFAIAKRYWVATPTTLKIVFGTAGLQRWNLETIKELFRTVREYGVRDLDCAHIYKSEGLTGNANAAETFTLHTKAPGFEDGCLTREKLESSMQQSLEQLRVAKVQTFFLHSPDPKTPLKETLSTMNDLHKAGKFERFGLSNFNVEEIEAVLRCCDHEKYVRPTVFQGNYNPVARHYEEELLPLLRKNNIALWVYSPLGGGFLAKSAEQFLAPMKGRWNEKTDVGKMYHELYGKPHLVAALNLWGEAAEKANCTRAALAYRWVLHHSKANAKLGDAMLIGTAGVEQLQQTLQCLRDGPLPAEVLPLIEKVWQMCKEEAPFDNYHG